MLTQLPRQVNAPRGPFPEGYSRIMRQLVATGFNHFAARQCGTHWTCPEEVPESPGSPSVGIPQLRGSVIATRLKNATRPCCGVHSRIRPGHNANGLEGVPPEAGHHQGKSTPWIFSDFKNAFCSMMAVVEVLVAKSCHSGPIRVSAGIVGARADRLRSCSISVTATTAAYQELRMRYTVEMRAAIRRK